MKCLLIKNKDNNKLSAIVLQGIDKKLYYTALTQTYSNVLKIMFSQARFYVEIRKDDRTIVKRQVKPSDPRYLEVLKTKILPPNVIYAEAVVEPKEVKNPSDALEKVWKMFSPFPHQEIVEV